MSAWFLLLPAAIVVMACGLYTAWRRPLRGESSGQVRVGARDGCRLASLSSVMLALAGLGCFDGPNGLACTLGWAMIVLGLLGAAAGVIVSERYLV